MAAHTLSTLLSTLFTLLPLYCISIFLRTGLAYHSMNETHCITAYELNEVYEYLANLLLVALFGWLGFWYGTLVIWPSCFRDFDRSTFVYTSMWLRPV